MKKISRFIIRSTIYLMMFMSVASFSYADTAPKDYTLLAPLPGTTIQDKCSGTKCTTNLEKYLPGVFNFIISISAVLAFMVITYGGVLYMTTDAINDKTKGKDYIEGALWGLGLVIGAWVILNTINPELLKFSLKLETPKTQVQSADTLGVGNAADLLPATTAALADLMKQCACNLNITSTTGDSHDPKSLHYQGKAVDMTSNPKLDSTITNNTTPKDCQTFTKTYGGKTTIFLWEKKGSRCGGEVASTGDHWHVSVP